MNHTKEPWKVFEWDDRQSAIHFMSVVSKLTGEMVASYLPIADAKRIVACVNACKDFTNEQLEKFTINPYVHDLEQRIELLEMQLEEMQLEEMQAKATAYDRLMSGGEKTLKEIANIFGSIVAMDESGRLHLFGMVPKINKNVGEWQPAYRSYHERVPICDIDFNGDWKDSLTLPDGWEE